MARPQDDDPVALEASLRGQPFTLLRVAKPFPEALGSIVAGIALGLRASPGRWTAPRSFDGLKCSRVDTRASDAENRTMRRIFFAALSCLVLCGLIVVAPSIARADKVYGAVLLNEARKIGPGRYQSMKDYERTVRFFRKVHGRTPGVVMRRMNTTPKVNGVHISNLRPGRTWDGINVYETGRKVFIYVIKSDLGTGKK